MLKRLIIFFSLLLLILVFLPKIASTPLVKPFFAKAIEKRTGAKAVLGPLNFSWLGPQKFKQLQWSKEEATGTVEELSIHAPFWSFSGPFELKNAVLFYEGKQVERLDGQIHDDAFQLTGEHVSLKGTIHSKQSFDLAVGITNFPLASLGRSLDQIFGSTLSVKGNVSSKDLDLTIATPNLQTRVVGTLQDHGITLKAPLIAAIRITQTLSQYLLKDADPLFLASIESRTPALLKIEPKGAFLPVPFSLEHLKAQGTLDLGQVKCRNGKSLAAVIALLKANLPTERMNAWFAPVDYQINQGVLTLGRLDLLLADSIHLCTWGTVDIPQDQIRMTLGLPADTLARSFGIKSLSENYVIKVDVRGSLKDPEVVKGPALTKIAALIAVTQVPKKGFFGDVAEVLSQPKEEKDVPPARRPFPWEK